MKGPILMLAGIGLFGLLDAISKTLSADYAVWQVLLVRFATILAVVFALRAAIPGWGGSLRTRHPRIHAVRAVAMLGSATFFFLAFSHLPLVEGYLVFFTAPFFVLALAALLLKEAVPRTAWGWVAVGFGGVAIGLAPGLLGGAGGAAIGYLWAFCGTLCYALVFVLNRSLRLEPGMARVLVWPALLGLLAMLGPGLWHWRAPEAWALALMVVNGVLVGAATACLAEAFRHASAARLAPFGYSGLVWSTTYDLVLFGHLPGWPLLLGAAVVVLSCVMSEREAAQNPAGKS
ncbi:DMT family transporter [Falsiroseomonas oryzae]|uniref:DMT family transporter n=1 Tax=Falsiroseomonas oryzae TaxID=2766473 RepID=UPI0022EAFAFA|nr:DMT family transporter [Roseomonas sp. MO-31]